MEKKIIVVSDEVDLREGLAPVLRETAGFTCTTFSIGEEAVEYVRRHPAHVALVSLDLPDMPGLECAEKLKSNLPDMEIIVLYGAGESGRVFEALKAGASGFLERETSSRSVLEAIFEVLRGGVPIARDAARKLAMHFRTPVRQKLGLQ